MFLACWLSVSTLNRNPDTGPNPSPDFNIKGLLHDLMLEHQSSPLQQSKKISARARAGAGVRVTVSGRVRAMVRSRVGPGTHPSGWGYGGGEETPLHDLISVRSLTLRLGPALTCGPAQGCTSP